MATNTRKSSSDTRAGKQPSYQYDPWDQDAGKYSSSLSNGEGQQDTSDLEQSGKHSKSREQQESATQSLRNAENDALSQRERSYVSNTKNDSLYTGAGRNSDEKNKPKGKFLRGKGALITILMFLTGGGIFLSSSHSLLAPAMSTLFTNKTQTNYSSWTLRSRYITSYMMKHNSGGAVTTGFTGKAKYTRIPNRLKARLATYNIEVEGTGSNTRMSWTHTTSTGGTETISNIDADTFLKMYNENVEFREDYTNARYGRAATFFDNVADKIYKKLGISRNLQRNYVQTGNAEVDADNYDKTLRPKFDGDDTNLSVHASEDWDEEVTIKKPDGTTETDTIHHESHPGGDSNGKTSSTTEIEAQQSAKGMIGTIADNVGRIGTATCTILKVGSMIGTAAAAMEMYQSINYFMAQMEGISKMKAGYGSESGINSLLNFMTTPETVDVQDYSPTLFEFPFLSNLSNDEEPPAQEAKMTQETGAPVEASGIQNLLANAPVGNSTQNYSLERIIKSLGGSAVFGAGTAMTCAGVRLINSIVSIAVTLSPAGLVALAGNFLTGVFKQTLLTVSMGAFFSFLVPTLANIFFRNVMDTAVGIPGGQFLARGAAAANMSSARRGSAQTPSGEQAILAANKVNNEVLAMEAEQDRHRLSPFDTSNPNTFFGSIAYSLLPTFTSSKITGLSSFLRSTSTSLSSLMSGVSAEGEGSTYTTTFGECPLLDEIGAKGDMYCNPIVTSDMSTEMINLDPDDSTYNHVLTEFENDDGIKNLTCNEDGNCKINEESNLAKFISYCDNRNSPSGVVDQNILNDLGYSSDFFILNNVPIIGDVIDGIDAANELLGDNVKWANDTRCSNTEKNSDFWNSEGKYYQVYINDQRILEQMGAYEGSTNPVIAYEEAYAESHPVEDSYIGYLSQISGLTMENTETVLAFVAYYTYIDNYDPTLRVAIEDMTLKLASEEVVATAEDERLLLEDDDIVDNPLETNTTSYKYVVYADIRNRNYAA